MMVWLVGWSAGSLAGWLVSANIRSKPTHNHQIVPVQRQGIVILRITGSTPQGGQQLALAPDFNFIPVRFAD